MLEIGIRQELQIQKLVDFGAYLVEDMGDKEESVLLPLKQVPQGAQVGDRIDVYLYKDSKDRIIATTREVPLTFDQVARLRVTQINRVGAFLDWGLEKELFLPYAQQTYQVQEGDECLVTLYVDKSDRLCATMKVYEYLSQDSPYQKEDRVKGKVYEIADSFGAFVAVDDCYSAMIPRQEMHGVQAGADIEARVVQVREDGKLTLSVRERSYVQMNEDATSLLQLLEAQGGSLLLHDKSSPEEISRVAKMSKNAFKRAVGNLLKNGKIILKEDRIVLLDQSESLG